MNTLCSDQIQHELQKVILLNAYSGATLLGSLVIKSYESSEVIKNYAKTSNRAIVGNFLLVPTFSKPMLRRIENYVQTAL